MSAPTPEELGRLSGLLYLVEATEGLKEAHTDTLLTTYAALTHQLHEVDSRPFHIRNPELAQRLRNERDLVRAEILLRTGDLP